MARKRSTKLSREATEEAKLRQRLLDFAIGANGGFAPELINDEYQLWNIGADSFGRFLYAAERQILGEKRRNLTRSYNLDQYDTLNSAVDFLYSNGVRHDSTSEDTE